MKGPTTATIDAKGNVTLKPEAAGSVSLERFTQDSVKEPTSLATALTRMVQTVVTALRALLGLRRSQTVTFENVACSTGATKVVLRHNLGRRARWSVAGWRGASTTTAPSLVSDENDASAVLTDKNTLALRSYVAGTADIEVF